MQIICPDCQFEKDLDLTKIPASATVATCPRCNKKFRFRAPMGSAQTNASSAADDSQVDTLIEASNTRQQRQDNKAPLLPHNLPQGQNQEPIPGTPAQSEEGEDPLPSGAIVPDLREQQKPDQGPEFNPLSQQGQNNVPQTLAQLLQEKLQNLFRPIAGSPTKADAADIPWERIDQYGILGGFLQTILRVMFNAPRFYANIRSTASPLLPLAFFVFLGLLQIAMTHLWLAPLQQLAISPDATQGEAMVMNVVGDTSLPLLLLLAPFSLLLQVMVFSSLIHLMLRLAQPDKANYLVAFRLVCYSAAPYILSLVPILGVQIASIWFTATVFIGCKYAYQLTWGRTTLVLAPLYILGMAMLQFMAASAGLISL